MAKPDDHKEHLRSARKPDGSPLVTQFEPDVHIVGLRRESSGRYVVVTGTLSNPIFDKSPDPLEYASEMLKRAVLHMLENIR